MATLTTEEFQSEIRSRYESEAMLALPLEISTQLDDSLRGIVVKLLEQVQLLQALTMHLSTGDPTTIQLVFRGELQQIVQAWQQAILSLPRATLAPNDPEFRDKVIARYNVPCDTMSIDELAQSLDDKLATSYITFWEFRYQLHLCVEELAKTRERDMGELTKQNLKQLVDMWKEAILNRPRSNVALHEQGN